MEKSQRTILVTCVGGEFIYDIVRALHGAPDFSARIIGCDVNPHARGRVLVDRFEPLPDAEKAPEDYMAAIFNLAKQERIDLVLPLSEGESRVLSQERAALRERGTAVTVSAPETVEVMTDKMTMLQHVQDRHLNCLDFRSVENLEELEAALDDLGYPDHPVVLKPRRTSGARGVMIFDAAAGGVEQHFNVRGSVRGARDVLLEQIRAKPLLLDGLIAVQYADGPIFDVDCIAVKGEATDIVPRLRQWRDPLSPASTGNRIDMRPDVIGYCRDLCRAFGVDGAGDFDVVLDSAGQPSVFDAGTRLSGSVGGALAAGANLPAQLVRVLTGLPRQEFNIRNGCVVRPFMTFAEISPERQQDLL